MGETTGIGWTDATDNPIRVKNPRAGEPGQPEAKGWWCRKISPECTNCYAETWNGRMGNGMKYIGEPPELILDRKMIDGWKKKGKAKRRFVASMTDVFGEWVPREWIFYMLDGMAAAPRQTFQVLTKWAERMAFEINAWLSARGLTELPDHIWPGVTAGTQESANKRIPWLLRIPSRRRWISAEPLLGAIDLIDMPWAEGFRLNALTGVATASDGAIVWSATFGGIVWVVVGGESGSDRPMHPVWAETLRDQTVAAGASFFFKQWGDWHPILDRDNDDPDWRADYTRFSESPRHRYVNLAGGSGFHGERLFVMERVGKKAAGDLLEGTEWKEFPDARAA